MSSSTRGLAVIATLAPAAALACSQCSDTLLSRIGWWARAPFWAAGALLLEAAFSALLYGMGALPRPRGGSLGLLWLGISSLGVVVGVLGLGFIVSAGFLSLALLGRLIHSLFAARGRAALHALRLLVVAALFGTGAVQSLPSNRSTMELIRLDARAPWFVPPSELNWIERELLRRPDALPLLEEALETGELPRPSLGVTEERLLQLHFRLGGKAEQRASACARRLPHARGEVDELAGACPTGASGHGAPGQRSDRIPELGSAETPALPRDPPAEAAKGTGSEAEGVGK